MKSTSTTLCLFVLCTVRFATGAEPLVKFKSGDWRYCENVTQSERGWQSPEFDDSKWPVGQAILGYGDRDVQTRLSFGANPQNKRPVALFRRRLILRRRVRFRRYLGRVCCDDGAVVYINGKEVHRRNMPNGRVTLTTHALLPVGSASVAERQTHPFLVDPQTVKDGTNLIAVSVHQANPTSSDLAFDMELVGLETEDEVKKAEESLLQTPDQMNQSSDEPPVMGPVFQYNTTSR